MCFTCYGSATINARMALLDVGYGDRPIHPEIDPVLRSYFYCFSILVPGDIHYPVCWVIVYSARYFKLLSSMDNYFFFHIRATGANSNGCSTDDIHFGKLSDAGSIQIAIKQKSFPMLKNRPKYLAYFYTKMIPDEEILT